MIDCPINREPAGDRAAPQAIESELRSLRRRDRRRWRNSAIAIVLLVLLWLVVLWQRDTLRAHWWAYRLEHAPTPMRQLQYFQYLVGVAPQAVGAVQPWLARPETGLRSFAVGVLHHARTPGARDLLIRAADDQNHDVRLSALLGLALYDDEPARAALARRLLGDDEARGMEVAYALGQARSPAATALLVQAVQQSPAAGVQVEAIVALEELQADEAIPALLQALRSSAVYQGQTERNRAAATLLAEVTAGPSIEDELRSATFTAPLRHDVALTAATALRRITGYDPGLDVTNEPASRAALIEAWDTWWHQQTPPAVNNRVSPPAP